MNRLTRTAAVITAAGLALTLGTVAAQAATPHASSQDDSICLCVQSPGT